MPRAQEIFPVPLVDKTSPGAPFRVKGKVTLKESVQGNRVEWSWGEHVTVKNISNKAILLFVVTITEVGRHSALGGRRVAPGDGPTYRIEDDRFFSERLIEPGESLVLRDTEPGNPDAACCINPSQAHETAAEYHLQFVQFANGSIFGDPAEARDSLVIRQIILRGLHELMQSYESGGESGFAAKLRDLQSYGVDPSLAPPVDQQPPFFTTVICRRVLAQYEVGGISAALEKTREILRTAEQHEVMIGSSPPS
jgi:hypothetical protein